jgi:hypothetical protein
MFQMGTNGWFFEVLRRVCSDTEDILDGDKPMVCFTLVRRLHFQSGISPNKRSFLRCASEIVRSF